MQNCLRDRSQKFIVNSFYSTRILVKYEVHQVSVLVPTLFFLTHFCVIRLFWLIQKILQVMLIILSTVLEKTNMELKLN